MSLQQTASKSNVRCLRLRRIKSGQISSPQCSQLVVLTIISATCLHRAQICSAASSDSNSVNSTRFALDTPPDPAGAAQLPMGSFFKFENSQAECKQFETTETTQIDSDTKQVVKELIRKRNESELPELTASHNPNDEIQLRATNNFFFHADQLHNMHSISDFGLMALVARGQAMVYADLFTHIYDNHLLMRQASGRQVDNELCIKQLTWLATRSQRQEVEKFRSRDLNLFRLMDTWGRMPAGLLLGNVFFHGMYEECLRLRIEMPEGETSAPSRYCVLHVKHVDWPRIDKHDLLNLKAGICLPRSCDSTNYKNKFDLIMQMVQYHLRRHEVGQVKFRSLYCLPDEDSPARSIWPHHPATVLLLALLGAWLSLLSWATYKYHQLQAKGLDGGVEIQKAGAGFGLTNAHVGRRRRRRSSTATSRSSQENGTHLELLKSTGPSEVQVKILEVLSITNNLRLLFDTTKESSLMDAGRRLSTDKVRNNEEAKTNSVADSENKEKLSSADGAKVALTRKCVDLRCIEGIKVIAMFYVIMGHVLMCITTLTANPKEMVINGSSAFFLTNLVPAFAVNAFFTITGLLTCYLMLKQNQSYCFVTSPGKWMAFIVYRYLRIMPMYVLTVLYCKHLAKFTGSGPLWDYATSALGQRRACELEPWHWTLTFTSNFMPPMRHCIPGGWYLSNDFQFFLVTPIFLMALYKAPKLGQNLLIGGVIAGYAAGFMSIFSTHLDDLRPIANFAPHGFKTYVSHFSFNYTQPQYRIPAYLIGLLIGYRLFQYEVDNENNKKLGKSGWSDRFQRLATPVSLTLVLICCITPFIGSRLIFTKWAARFMVSLITPSYHVLFALAVGLYLLLATTGHGNQRLNSFLAAPQWKPLARLSLCAVLVNVETINFIIQGDTSQHLVTTQFHIAMNCLCIIATYLVATLVCVLFEAPIRGALNAILTLAIEKVAAANKKRSLSVISTTSVSQLQNGTGKTTKTE